METITEYRSVLDHDVEAFQNRINKLIEDGFQPFGSVSLAFVPDESTLYMCQAMVKTK
jgi:hypothetical protein